MLESSDRTDLARAEDLVDALGAIGPQDNRYVRAVTRLCDPKMKVTSDARRSAFYMLRKLGPRANSAVPTLIACLNSSLGDSNASYLAIAFAGIGSPAVEPLIVNLKKSQGKAQIRTIRMLAAIGPAAKAALPALRELMGNQRIREGRYAKDAIRQIMKSNQ